MTAPRSGCCEVSETCRTDECSGVDLIQDLLPSGRLWDLNRTSKLASFFKAIGHVFTDLRTALCQEFAETNPCTSVRLLETWATVYCFPTCVDLTTDNMCEWVGILFDETCPRGSIGFYKTVTQWVIGKTGGCPDLELTFNQRGAYATTWRESYDEADLNTMVVIAPPSCYMFDTEKQCYFIPEIECLRRFVFPMGLTVGYKTNPTGPNGEDIFGVPSANIGTKPSIYYDCKRVC